MTDDLQNEIEHLRAVCELRALNLQQSEEIARLRAIAYSWSATCSQQEAEITRLKAIIEQMLAETGHGGNKACGDNRLTPETIAKAKGAIA